MASPRIDVRRAPKRQGRWWIITLNDREIYRETTAKEARRFARQVPQMPGIGSQPLYNRDYVGGGSFSTERIPFWCEPEPLETQ